MLVVNNNRLSHNIRIKDRPWLKNIRFVYDILVFKHW